MDYSAETNAANTQVLTESDSGHIINFTAVDFDLLNFDSQLGTPI